MEAHSNAWLLAQMKISSTMAYAWPQRTQIGSRSRCQRSNPDAAKMSQAKPSSFLKISC